MIAPSHAHAKVLEVLARAGVCHARGVMVGTLAFQCQANMLGINRTGRRRILGTQDIDLAESPRVNVAADQGAQSLHEAILDSGPGFFEVPALDASKPSTAYRVRGQSLRIDILTPASPRNRDQNPIPVPGTPMRNHYGIWSLCWPMHNRPSCWPAPAFTSTYRPGRYALHKLFVQRQRPATENSKAQRDREQAAFLIEALREQRPGDLYLAADAAAAQGKRFRSAVVTGLKDLEKTELVSHISNSTKEHG